ncbi:hypothetical protein VTL71DRAFT_13882 [Oculimacula yallundae]|uniref:Uncharacterized protein n=1 Tax=Oculimacula yallundae TaxID=86028 RepID=A0ABR4CLL6_9HELO
MGSPARLGIAWHREEPAIVAGGPTLVHSIAKQETGLAASRITQLLGWDKKAAGPFTIAALDYYYLPTVLLTAHPVCLQFLLYPQTEALCYYTKLTNERPTRIS